MDNKIQKLVKEISKNKRIQAVMAEVHQLQNKLNDEMSKTLAAFKTSAGDIEKNVQTYKKQLLAQKDRLEKEVRAKAKQMQGKSTSKKASSKKASSTAAKSTSAKASTTKKKATRKASTTRKASSQKKA